jgi:homoserine dehydrogenase
MELLASSSTGQGSMEEKTIGITLLGCGAVGSGVVRILTEQRDLLRKRTGLTFEIRHVVVRDMAKKRGVSHGPLTTDAEKAIDDPEVSIVVELIGGTSKAASHIERALKLGKHVVTANKSLLASRGVELFGLARKHHACIAFEASAGGGVPIINALVRGLIANRIEALVGIVNGTCNVILTRMTRNGWSYQEALKEAQEQGFAEADPTLDVSGQDAAQKLAILASLAFNTRVSQHDIHVEGIEKLQKAEIDYARDLGYVIKLLAIARRQEDDRLALRVHPTLVHADDVLAEVSGSFNAISVYGDALGHSLFYGRGAGQMPTASAVVSDLISVALGTAQLEFDRLQIYPDKTTPASVLPFDQTESRYYLRLMARDEPGVLAQVTKILGDHGISLSAIQQRETDAGQFVPIVITTHLAREGAMRDAIVAIDALASVNAPTVCLRVLELPKEFAGST